MNIYLAADYARKDEMRGCRDVIEGLGHKVVSKWIDAPDDTEAMGIGGRPITEDNWGHGMAFALTDMSDLMSADLVIHFTTGEKSRGGRHVEFGMALALYKQVAIIGPRESVFHCHPAIAQYSTWRAFVIDFSRGWSS